MSERVTQEDFFARIPKAIVYHPELTGNDVRVYATLSERGGDRRAAWPGMRRIAADIKLSTTTVQKALDRLEDLKLIEVERTDGKVNHYHLPLITVSEIDTGTVLESETPDQEAVSDPGTPPSQNLTRGVSESDTELDQRTRPRELDPAAAAAELPAVRWARRWAELRGIPFAPAVKRSWSSQVQGLIGAKVEITEDLLQRALAEGIREPKAWPYVASKGEQVPDFIEAHWEERRRKAEGL